MMNGSFFRVRGVSPESQDVARIERAIAELQRLSDSRRLHEARMRSLGLGLSRTELRFLHRLDDLGPLAVSRLADALDVSQPTASRALHRLEEEGLVTRAPAADDGRVAIYALTPKGRRARRRVLDFTRGQLADSLAGLPTRRRHELADALDELVGRLQRGGPTTAKETA
jgi:DNA-binding MarR family transcriptional regulator